MTTDIEYSDELYEALQMYLSKTPEGFYFKDHYFLSDCAKEFSVDKSKLTSLVDLHFNGLRRMGHSWVEIDPTKLALIFEMTQEDKALTYISYPITIQFIQDKVFTDQEVNNSNCMIEGKRGFIFIDPGIPLRGEVKLHIHHPRSPGVFKQYKGELSSEVSHYTWAGNAKMRFLIK